MPFLLRRTKDEVLSDLPEKIIQDRYCDLSTVQLKLYEQFSGSRAKQEVSSIVTTNESATGEGSGSSTKASSHVFQAMLFIFLLVNYVPSTCFLTRFLSLKPIPFFRHSNTC